MAKTTKVIVFAAVMVVGAAMVFAQTSNANQATFGELGTDVDDYLDSVSWKGVEFTGLFGFTRIGANIREGRTEMGVAFRPGSLYLGFYYAGDVMGYKETSTTEKFTLRSGNDTEDITVRIHGKANPKATYAALAGLGNGMGIKFQFDDDLRVQPNGTGTPYAGGSDVGDTWRGTLTPMLEVGGSFGPISKIRLSVPIGYSRREVVNASGSSVTYSTYTLNDNGSALASQANLLDIKDGNYVGPDIYLKMGFGSLTLENNLRLRFYGIPAYEKDGKAGSQPGNGVVVTNYDFKTSSYNTREALWDNRFFIEDEIKPSFNISGDSGKLTYSVTAGLPLVIGGSSHALSYKYEVTGTGSRDDKDYYKGGDFHLNIGPSVAAGVRYQLLDILSVQCGLGADIFKWGLETKTQTKVDAPSGWAANGTYSAFVGGGGGSGITLSPSTDSSETEFTWTYPKVSMAFGTTLTLAQKIGLDLLIFNQFIPSATGMVYKAVGEATGSSGASVVLSVKL